MTTYILIPGAGGAGEVYWRQAAAELEARGHEAISVDFDAPDPALGLPEFAAITDDAIGDRTDVVAVAQSLGGFTPPMLSKLDAVARIVFVNAMIPLPGETPGHWFEATGSGEAMTKSDRALGRTGGFEAPDAIEWYFLHDIPAEIAPEMAEGDREPADTPFGQPCTFEAWPDIPIHVIVGADDRMFPAEFQQRVAKDRLGLDADVIRGGHLVAKSRPAPFVDQLLSYI